MLTAHSIRAAGRGRADNGERVPEPRNLARLHRICAALALLGSYVAARAFGATTERFTLGTVRVAVKPALSGRVDVYVPIVDWGVRAARPPDMAGTGIRAGACGVRQACSTPCGGTALGDLNVPR